jgi:hypothetical protein
MGKLRSTISHIINHLVCGPDNGRVLGYDNSHEWHHRHFMGNAEPVEFTDYASLVKRFEEEVRELWRQEDEQNRQESQTSGHG